MTTLLQRLLIETLTENQDSILRLFINTVLPAMERVFALTSALGGSKAPFSKNADQGLVVHVINGLLTAWNLSKHLSEPLLEDEQRSLCLGFTLHDYDKYIHSEGIDTPEAHETLRIRNTCFDLAQQLGFQEFWSDWQNYLLDICYLAQNTQAKKGSNLASSNWEVKGYTFQIDYPERNRLCELLRFGDIAVHMNDPAESAIATQRGKQLQKCLDQLDINKKLVYHRLRDCRGLLTNQIHNAVVRNVDKLSWQPILYFAQGVAYLAPVQPEAPTLSNIQSFVWQSILKGDPKINQEGLEDYFSNGEVGLIRGPHGLKFAPLTLELFPPAELIRLLPYVVTVKVANVKDPATPKRLQTLALSAEEQKRLLPGASVWADRLAELIVLTQREFFESVEKRNQYISWILTALELQGKLTPEQTQVQSGGVNYGWYHAAAHYISSLPSHIDRRPDSEELAELLSSLSDRLATWAEENHLLPEHKNPTREVFLSYVEQYLEVSEWEQISTEFQNELTVYSNAKVTNKPICSLSSGEFAAEEQLDSVVLFKPQQYSNKNALGGGRIKRGISKIWSLEMLLRQAYWAAPAGKLEDQQPIFLYVFPAYVYSPQTACAVGVLINQLQKTNLWDVRSQWRDAGSQFSGLYNLPWQAKEPKAGRYGSDYSTTDLPFMAMRYTRTMGDTLTDAWVEPAFLALALPMLLGVKVVVTASPDPLYASDKEFLETVKLDGAAGFWNLLGFSSSLRLDEIQKVLERLLVAYSLHLDNRSKRPDARWQAFNGTVRDLVTDVLNVFAIAQEGLRRDKRSSWTPEEVKRYWSYAKRWIESANEHGSESKTEGDRYRMDLIEKLARQYREFYRVGEDELGNIYSSESSYSILRPFSIALEVILKSPHWVDQEFLIKTGTGQISDALKRGERYNRSLRKDEAQELRAIREFMSTCVNELFVSLCKHDPALLQENRNRLKSGVETAYRFLALDKQSQAQQSESTK